MIVVFFIAIFLSLCILLIMLNQLCLRIDNLHYTNYPKVEFQYRVHIELKLLGKWKIFCIMLTKEKINKIIEKSKFKKKIEKMNWERIKKELPNKKQSKEILNKLQIDLREFHFKLDIGTENVILTSFIIMILSSFLGIVLGRIIEKYEKEKHEYKILPVYKNRNQIKLCLNCIIQVKMVHIIVIIIKLLKRKEKKKYERTSNRRSYDDCYE